MLYVMIGECCYVQGYTNLMKVCLTTLVLTTSIYTDRPGKHTYPCLQLSPSRLCSGSMVGIEPPGEMAYFSGSSSSVSYCFCFCLVLFLAPSGVGTKLDGARNNTRRVVPGSVLCCSELRLVLFQAPSIVVPGFVYCCS